MDWNFEPDYSDLLNNPVITQYDYGMTDNDISVLDYIPTSDIFTDCKFEELTSAPSCLTLEQQEVKVIAGETEPCAAALAIEANIPTPDTRAISKWRTFISAAYYHPNILAHVDVAGLKELFKLLGSDISFESANVMIDLGKTIEDYKPVPYLRPMQHSTGKPQIFNFAHVKEFFIDIELKVCIVKKYGINNCMKKAVDEMVTFIVEYPEALYLEVYGFILDFLLKFGVPSDVIIDVVMRTQTRRRKSQKPGSVLILKKANTLGKGRREFLQKKILETPEQKYHPVVPIISDPTPVRCLRNRRTGVIDSDRTPNDKTLVCQISAKVPEMESSVPTDNKLVFAVKRKLCFDDVEKGEYMSPAHPLSVVKVGKNTTATPAFLTGRKRRFYGRRDSNTIEKPFVCNICVDRSFAYKGNLVLHMKKKHSTGYSAKVNPKRQENELPRFSCPVCLRGYASKYKCKEHMQRYHPELEEWCPIANEEAICKFKKTTTKTKVVKHTVNRSSTQVVRKSSRRSLLPLYQTQNSPPEDNKPSQVFLPNQSNADCYTKRRNVPISNGPSIALNERPYSTRTRQQLRAAIK